MEQHLFVLLLFTGILPPVLSVPSVPRYYYLIQEEKSWDDARAYCRQTYTDLATIDSEEDMTKLQEEAQAQQFSSGAWIGLYTNINSWYWTFYNETLGSFTAWHPTQPDNLRGNDQCAAILGDGVGLWSDIGCHKTFSFICFDDMKTGADRYILIPDLKTWDEAQSYCRQHYTDLASARDATENSAVQAVTPGATSWFGLRREPMKWSDQTTDVSLIQWSGGVMDDYILNQSCVFLSNGVADAAQCGDIKPFFCYLFPDHQQILRVKVSSREDVNDPAITAAILEKIEQKLKDQGLSGNITVKWRRKPNGLVFHKEKKNNTLIVKNTRGSCDLE